jgi:hypothetical protein
MTAAFYREQARRCLESHRDLLPEGFQAVFQHSHDYGLLETVHGTLPDGLARCLRGELAGGGAERTLVVLDRRFRPHPQAPAGAVVIRLLEGWPVLSSRDPLADLAALAALDTRSRVLLAEQVLQDLGHLPPADAQSPEAARRRVSTGTGLL